MSTSSEKTQVFHDPHCHHDLNQNSVGSVTASKAHAHHKHEDHDHHDHDHEHDHDHDHDIVDHLSLSSFQISNSAVVSVPQPPLTISNKSTNQQSQIVKDQPADNLYRGNDEKKHEEYRNYSNSARQERVQKFYTEQHIKQTYDLVLSKEKEYSNLNKHKMGVWEALEYLNTFVDDSDPDTDLSQLQHALQTAEAIRTKYHDKPQFDWFPLVGLIHDLGKILCFSYGEPQYLTVGDTFPVGCKFSDKNVFPEAFKQNPDDVHPIYSTFYGAYKPNCGLDNVHMSWGHDEYLYRVCIQNGSTLPKPALYMIRYHSFYPWHKEGAYTHLTNSLDREMLMWVKEFNQFDLYSKSDNAPDVSLLKPYYCALIDKYFPNKVLRW